MSILDILADRNIAEAIADGKLDNLPGKGKPLVMDEDNLRLPREQRAMYRLLKQAGIVPNWIQQVKDTAALDAEIDRELRSSARMHAQFTDELVLIPSPALFARAKQWHAETRQNFVELVKRRAHMFRSYDAAAPQSADRSMARDSETLIRAFDAQVTPFKV